MLTKYKKIPRELLEAKALLEAYGLHTPKSVWVDNLLKAKEVVIRAECEKVINQLTGK